MSEQRRLRSELKQGLHQFLMTLYNSYRQTNNHEASVEQLASCLSEEYEYFTKEKLNKENTSSNLQPLITELEQRARRERDSSEQYALYQDMETLVNAQEILSKYNLPEGSK